MSRFSQKQQVHSEAMHVVCFDRDSCRVGIVAPAMPNSQCGRQKLHVQHRITEETQRMMNMSHVVAAGHENQQQVRVADETCVLRGSYEGLHHFVEL